MTMLIALFKNRLTAVWAFLVLATLISVESVGLGANSQPLATALITLIAFVKVRFIGLEFMELRHAPPWLRLAFEGWTLVVCVALVVLNYMVASNSAP
jgi:hypothetical protein